MGICRFKTSELKPLIEHAKAAAEYDMGYENMTDEECIAAGLPTITNRTPRGPALLFVHDQGVYLMSNGIPRFRPENPAQDVNSCHVAYAEGCNPNIGEFDDWYGTSRELVGGDDFVEILPIHDYWLDDCDVFETFEIDANSSSISYGFTDPRPTAPSPAIAATQEPAIMQQPISELYLSVRARKALHKLGAASAVYQVVALRADDLMECRGFGVTSLNEIRRALAEHNLTLKGETLADQRHLVSR